MSALTRRSFLRRGAAVAGLLAIAGPLRAYGANVALGAPTEAPGYGPLVDRGELSLPRGFQYRVVSRSGDAMADGNPTPGLFDGMGAFEGPDGTTLLIRNHENRQSSYLPFPAFEAPVIVPEDRRYDARPEFNAGVTKLVVSPAREPVESYALLGGTSWNCAGGPTPWGSWLTCEETFEDGAQPHGYVFEVDAAATAPVAAEPITAAGRFRHEAVAWHEGLLYETEDVVDSDVGFYRYLPREQPRRAGDLARSTGTLEALAIVGSPGATTASGFPVGEPVDVYWVGVPDPEPLADDVREQAHSTGAARFTRTEGIWVGDGRVYFACTTGGAAGQGQIWGYDPAAETLELVYESPGPDTLSEPDNLVVAPTGDIFVCEGSERPSVHGLTLDGRLYELAGTTTNTSELCGICFSPDGQTLFVNQQGGRGPLGPEPEAVTYAIWGPFTERIGL